MSYYRPSETWKIVYNLPPMQQNGGVKGVALVEAECHSDAMYAFQKQYAGQYSTVQSCTKLLG